jgi:hypothetical protein
MPTTKKPQGNRRERKELTRRLRSEDPGLEVVHPDAAGIDVGNSAHYVAVRGDRDPMASVCRKIYLWINGINLPIKLGSPHKR